MAKLQENLAYLGNVATHPELILRDHLARGEKVVGCIPLYTPEELVHAAGMIPMGLWGGQTTPTMAGKYNPIFTCSIMRSCLEYGMTGVYTGISCVLLPILCDTLRGMSSAWRAGVEEIPIVSFIQPQNREDPGALPFLVDEYESVRKRLGKITGCTITDGALERSIRVYNDHSAVMMEFAEIASDHLDVITPVTRHHIMKSGLFLEKSEHARIVREIMDELKQLPVHDWRGKRIILSGITAEPDTFLALFEENGITVVGDDLAQESRQYRTPIPEGGSPMERLARQWFGRKGCSAIHESDPSRGRMLVEMAKRYQADGIAICLMRFCDVEEYDYPYLSKAAEEAGVRCLCLEIDQSTQDNGQSRTKIQSFAEMN